ncbi:MAG: hypothetical protein IJH05_01675 [Firmicutes bacterium]|nr:hypothetical protein [Bacillota bacterium]
MALDLDNWTAEYLSEELADRDDLGLMTLRQAIDLYTREKLTAILEKTNYDRWIEIPVTKSAEQNADLQRELDFCIGSLRMVIDETDTVLLLMPLEGGDPGWLFAQGIEIIGAKAIPYGEAFAEKETGGRKEADQILQIIRDERVTCVIATPTHMVALARAAARQVEAGAEEIYLRSVLLTGGFAPDKTVMLLEETFQAMVFEFSAIPEAGLGITVSCGYGRGGHIREADLFIELINPATEEVIRFESPKTPGFSNYGEIVLTTLNREDAPLIRYRTGYYSRWIFGTCPCGSQLKRLDKIIPGEGE